MAKDWAKPFYNSKEWLSCRESYISKRRLIDAGMCEHCKARLGFIVDHKEELTAETVTDPMVSLNHNNFQYLCLPCHNKKTFGKGELLCGFDQDGNPIER